MSAYQLVMLIRSQLSQSFEVERLCADSPLLPSERALCRFSVHPSNNSQLIRRQVYVRSAVTLASHIWSDDGCICLNGRCFGMLGAFMSPLELPGSAGILDGVSGTFLRTKWLLVLPDGLDIRALMGGIDKPAPPDGDLEPSCDRIYESRLAFFVEFALRASTGELMLFWRRTLAFLRTFLVNSPNLL